MNTFPSLFPENVSREMRLPHVTAALRLHFCEVNTRWYHGNSVLRRLWLAGDFFVLGVHYGQQSHR